jgi:dTDP-4-dehydrorhamnose 3,5-epimerase
MPKFKKIETDRFVVEKTELHELHVIKQKPIIDHRGEFTRLYCQEQFLTAGLKKPIVQINKSKTLRAGSIRGMHLQSGTSAEDKIVSCVAGKVFDVAVDMRPGSQTYLCWFGVELSSENHTSLLIPAGFAHGFQSLEANSEIIYFVTHKYDNLAENGVHPFDPALGIKWPLACTDISEKDATRQFIDTCSNE